MDTNEAKGEEARAENSKTTWDRMVATDPGVRISLIHQKVEVLKAVNGDLDAFKAAWDEVSKV